MKAGQYSPLGIRALRVEIEMNLRAAPGGQCIAATALLILASFGISGCVGSAAPVRVEVGRASYLSPSVDVPNARYTYGHPDAPKDSVDVALPPIGVEFDVARVNVVVHPCDA